ncbi:MAG: VOC family protein [Pseudomonadales bacterium]|nr:VOC family protein [Pseudomonadales bacterium]
MNSPNPERLSLFYLDTFGGNKLITTDSSIVITTPGYAEAGPLITIRKSSSNNKQPLQAFDHGYAHICFEADNVNAIAQRFLENGGKMLSRFDTTKGALAFYGADPDGNVIEVHLPFPTPLTPRTLYRTLNSFARTKLGLPGAPNNQIRFIHVNINSPNWSKTAAFYQSAFSAQPTGFTRDYEGAYISALTGVPGAAVQGIHIALPGYSKGGPTFEVFTYNQPSHREPLGNEDIGRVRTEFITSNLALVVGRVKSAGGTIIEQRENISALVKDLDGNLIFLKQRELIPEMPIPPRENKE